MKTKTTNTRHAATEEQPLHRTLKARAAAALTAGCLAVSLCPAAAAFATPGNSADAAPGGNPPAMQQTFDNNQQAPSGQPGAGNQMPGGDEQAPGGQAPSGNQQAPGGQGGQGGPGGQPANDGVDDQVRTILSEDYDVNAQLPDQSGQPGQPGDNAGQPPAGNAGAPTEAPELPEGAVNVQAVIDSVRDVVGHYGSDALEAADFSNEDFAAEMKAFVKSSFGQRMEMFANGKPGDAASQPSTGDSAQPADGQTPPAAPSGNQMSSSIVSSIISLVYSALGYSA